MLTDKSSRLLVKILILPCLLLTGGCVSTVSEQIRERETGLNRGESLVVVGRRDSLGYEAQSSLIECLDKSITRIKTIPQKQFADSVFPWFEPRTAPQNLEELETLLQKPAVAERIQADKIRYLAWTDIRKRTLDKRGNMNCAVSTLGGLCLGIIYWQKDVVYEVVVWDVQALHTAGRMRSESEGSSAILGAIIPIPLITSPGRTSCKAMAKQLSSFIQGKDDTTS